MKFERIYSIAAQIKQGNTEGTRPRWTLHIDESTIPAGESIESVMEQIADKIDKGFKAGLSPVWNLMITTDAELDFYEHSDVVSLFEVEDGIAIIDFEKGEIYSVHLDIETNTIVDVYYDCDYSIMDLLSKHDLDTIKWVIDNSDVPVHIEDF